MNGSGAAVCSKEDAWARDRKSTRLNSSHLGISYAVFCLKKKKTYKKDEVKHPKTTINKPFSLHDWTVCNETQIRSSETHALARMIKILDYREHVSARYRV